MGAGKELRERFSQPQKAQEQSASISEILGITAISMTETIIDDIVAMIKKDYILSLEGYIFCLSRIMKHEVAWKCIEVAFRKAKTRIPSKYYKQFGVDPHNMPPPKGTVQS